MLAQIFESILSNLGELFLSKVADYAHNNVKSITEFEITLQTLQKKLKSLSDNASDVEDQIKIAELSGRKKRKRQVEEWLGEVESIETEVVELLTEVESEGFIMRLMDGGKAAQLIEQVDKLVEKSQNFGELLLDVCGTRGVTFLTTRMVGKAFKENFGRILRLLETGEVSSIGVHGMGGSGKTTLVKQINNRLLEQSQGRVFWVTVSQEFTIKSLQDKIARFLGVNFLGEDDEGLRAERLYGALSQQKNSVVILDDVWENIDLLKVGCPFSVECCRLIITSRSLEVCRQIGCQEVITVQKLLEHEAWNLFNETFRVGKEVKLGPQVEEIAKSVAKLCDGLPLGIITLAGSMRGETSIHTWENALVELKESIMGEVEVFKVLKHSFDRLKKNHGSQSNEFNLFQLCFLYCSFYPEDKEIVRDDLVRNFITEGLVDQRKSRKSQVHQGHVVLDKLVNVCLLERCVDMNRIECVKMHDLVRVMALKIGGGKYIVRAGDYSLKEIPMEEEWIKDLEKISLMNNGITKIEDGTSPNCSNLSTLLLQGNPLEFIPISFFSKMQGLCTLDLCGTDITKLPNSISELKSLKALLLENCYELENVPYLGNLKALRELNLNYTAVKEVPGGVEELLNLKFLSIDAPDLEMLPEGLLVKLVRLQYVKFPFHVAAPIEGIENLKQLEEFCGTVKNVGDFNCFLKSGQNRVHDTCYRILVGKVTHEYCSPCYSKKVSMVKCNVKEEVEKYKKVLSREIEWLTIRKCEGLSNCLLDDFSGLINPSSLKKLEIERCGGIECILISHQELASLEEIELRGLQDLKGIVIEKREIGGSPTPPQGVFCSLKRLKIHNCNKMRKLGLPVKGFPNLECMGISECGEIEEIFEDEGRGSNVALPRLQNLRLWGLPRLKSICNATVICSSIEKIALWNCPRMMKKQLPLHLDDPPPPSLKEIMVKGEWWDSLEWKNPNLPNLLQPFLKFL